MEEFIRFKIAPWVSTWDVVERFDSEARPFLMGLNKYSNRMSNLRTNVFLPSYQSWTFDCVFKIIIVVLHRRKTENRAKMSMFDQAMNEHAPFDSNTRNDLLRFCWCHRGMHKTKPICRKNSPAATMLVIKKLMLHVIESIVASKMKKNMLY